MPREPRKRGKGKNDKKKRGISNDLICIETGIDRKGNIVMGAVCNGRIKTEDIIQFFDGKLGEDVTFVVDSHKSYIGIFSSYIYKHIFNSITVLILFT